jgi:Holliday junction DNA helicase RuvA
MFEYIKGTLVGLEMDHLVLDNHGIGYKIFIPINLFSKSLKIGDGLTIYISAIYREDSQKLYGFMTKKDQQSFEKLLNVTGIGPKSALSLVGHLETHDLEGAIATGNIATLSKIPGIGKKTAERLILELKDKVKLQGKDTPIYQNATVQDATFALINLGYPQKEAYQMIQKALKNTDQGIDIADLIKTALKLSV